ncbi:MAG TPA: FAD-dependent oxidoreductase, partial [Thermoanaerobaculia bacterium]|nr:FAD-dependent oxidoreductase [Thermoanaerobaculia bacterium]
MTKNPAGSDESLSIWIDTSPGTRYAAFSGEAEADVAIVGAGITGITAAYLLSKEGRSVILVDKGRIAMSETGHTTAHIVDATDADYEQLVKTHGEEHARLDTEAIRSSVKLIRSLVEELKIDCGFKSVDGYLYAEEEKDREYLKRQHDYLKGAGMETEWIDEVPLPFPTIGGLRYRNQHVFHIRQYL